MSTNSQKSTPDDNISQLISIYSSTFEYLKKYGPKKDKNYELIKDTCSLFKSQTLTSLTFEQIKEYSLLLVHPFETYDIKTAEGIVITVNEIFSRNLIDSSILQEIVNKLLIQLHKLNIFIEETFNYKVLSLCLKIYTSENIAIHEVYLKYILKIFLIIFLDWKNPRCQSSVKTTLSQIIDHMIKKIDTAYNQINFNSTLNNKSNQKGSQYNEYTSLSKVIINYITDLIEISYSIEPNDSQKIILKYIKTIKEGNNIRTKIEALHLENYNSKITNENNANIGKFGWCVNCRNTADLFSDKINLPICDNHKCENEIYKMLNFIDNQNNFKENPYRKDYILSISYLVKYLTLESPKLKEFCFEVLQELFEKAKDKEKNIYYFSDDSDLIKIIKDVLMNSLVKNTLSNDIKILSLSVNLFLVVIKRFKLHLKEQIEIFFNQVFLVILESENLSFEYKGVVLKALLELGNENNSSFLIEIYVNYDCDMNYKAVFAELINLLTKIINGMYKKAKYATLLKPIQERTLKLKCLDFLTQFIFNISKIVHNSIGNINNIKSPNENNEIIVNESEETYNSSILEAFPVLGDLKDKINQTLKVKALLSKAIEKFNIFSPSQCLNFLKANRLIIEQNTFNAFKDEYLKSISTHNKIILKNSINDNYTEDLILQEGMENINIMQTPFISNINPLLFLLQSLDSEKAINLTYESFTAFEMARFIRSNITELTRDKVGDYLCSGKDFNKKVVEYFIDSFQFKDLHILDALRALFVELPLIGEGQVVDRIVLIFGEKYYRENPTTLNNPDICYYLAFSIIMLNTDLHREEVEKKMTLNEYVKRLLSMCPTEKISEKLLEDVYYGVLNNPLIIPGQKIATKKNKQELIELEKEKIITTVAKMKKQTISSIYILDISNEDIKNLLNCSWSNFLGIFGLLLADFDDEKIVITCINNILRLGGTCAILHLDTISEAFINTIINATNLSDGREINRKNQECIVGLIDFVLLYGQYIRTCWYNILTVISKIDFYLSSSNDMNGFIREIKYRYKKTTEKELELEQRNLESIKRLKLEMKCDTLFSKTTFFEEEAVNNFVENLCQVSKNELDNYYSPRVYSLHKLVEVADFNIFRIQIEWVSIWEKISNHFNSVILKSKHENVWRETLDSLKQTICKLLQKPDLSGYGFQKDFFKPFAVIFSQTINSPTRGEMILSYISYISGTYTKYIHSGWIIIFDILIEGLKRGNDKMNDDIKNTLDKIRNDFTIFSNSNEVFVGYIKCLCYMYIDRNLKQYSLNILLNMLPNIFNDINNAQEDKKGTNKAIARNDKKNEFIKIFLYGLDDLIKMSVEEHLNLLYEIIKKNKNVFFDKDSNSFIYSYFCYFKPHLASLILSFYQNQANNYSSEVKYSKIFHIVNNIEDSYYNIKTFLETSIEEKIQLLKEEENKNKMILILKGIKKSYNKDSELLMNKLRIVHELNELNYQKELQIFIEKIIDILKFNSNNNLFSFYDDLIMTIQSLSFHTKYSNIIFSILEKLIDLTGELFTEKTWDNISKVNILYLQIISSLNLNINERDLSIVIEFCSSYLVFIKFLFGKFYSKIISISNDSTKSQIYKTLCLIESKFLQIDLENKYPKYTLITSKETIEILKSLQSIKMTLISQTDNIDIYYDNSYFSFLNHFNSIYLKYNLSESDNEDIFQIFQTELEKIMPNFLKLFSKEELETMFTSVITFIDSKNTTLRKACKALLMQFLSDKLCIFQQYKK